MLMISTLVFFFSSYTYSHLSSRYVKITFDVNALVVSLTPNHRWKAKWVIVRNVLTQNRLGNQPKFFENEDMNGKAFCFISSLVEH